MLSNTEFLQTISTARDAGLDADASLTVAHLVEAVERCDPAFSRDQLDGVTTWAIELYPTSESEVQE